MYYNNTFNRLYCLHNGGLRRFREATNFVLHILNHAHYNVEIYRIRPCETLFETSSEEVDWKGRSLIQKGLLFFEGKLKDSSFRQFVVITKICFNSYEISFLSL